MSKQASHIFKDPPENTEYSEQVDDVVTKLLNLFVSSQQMIETQEQQGRRRDILNDLEQKISQWVYDTYNKLYSQYMTNYKVGNPNTRLAFIQPYGSYYLETHNSSSDIDTVVIFPNYVSEQTFFETFPFLLKQTRGITKAQYIQAKHPILNIVYNGYEIDIQPAKLTASTVTRVVDWLDPMAFEDCSMKSKGVLAAITTNVKVRKMMDELGLFQTFQQLVRILKYGFDQMLITGNKIGYFGGINIVLLVANVLFISQKKLSLCQYLYAFLEYYCRYDFRKPIVLCEDVGYFPKEMPMQIITITKPEINSTMKVNESTKFVIQKQLNEARKSYEYFIKLVATAMRSNATKILLKPELCKMIFCQLVEPKTQEIPTRYKLLEHSQYFFRDPELKNVLMVQLSSVQKELIEKVKEKLEPLFTSLFRALEELKSDQSGTYAKVSYARPRPGWKDIQDGDKFKSSFYIAIAKTEGAKDWLIEKLQAVNKNFRVKCRTHMELEDVDVQNTVMDMKIEIVNQKQLQE